MKLILRQCANRIVQSVEELRLSAKRMAHGVKNGSPCALRLALCIFILPLSAVISQPSRGWLTVDTIMQHPSWMGTSPKNVWWSEDGSWIYFTWRTTGDNGDSLYKVRPSGGAPERVSMDERRALPPPNGDFTNDHRRKTFERDGDVFVLDVRRGTQQRLTQTIDAESDPKFTRNEKGITFERNGNLFRRDLENGLETQLTNVRSGSMPRDPQKTTLQAYLERQQMELFEVLRKRKADREADRKFRELLAKREVKPYYIGQKTAMRFVLSPDERHVTFMLSERPSGQKQSIVPKYITESGFTEDITARSKVGDPPTTQEFCLYDIVRDSVIVLSPDSIPGILAVSSDTAKSKKAKARDVSYAGPWWSDNGTKAAVQVYSWDNKDRWIVLLDAERARFGKVVEHQRDTAWIGGPGMFGNNIGWMPESERMWFQSEADGWSHLYVVDADGGKKRQLTRGTFEVYGPRISRDKKRWYFSSNEVHFGERHFYSMPLEGGSRTRITSMEGRNDAFLSADEETIALLHSFSNRMPELFVMDNAPGAKVRQETDSPSKEFRAYDWRAPEVLTILARDGAHVPARLYAPEKPNGAAVIFVHGAGYLQNAHKWWSDYFREYMFNNLLADKGYTVLDIDYRASAGLGRDWRTAIYRYMGGKDLDDQVDGARWLVSTHGIDPKRIGLYGGSYGGFITLMALFTQPDVFAAGAALRSVTDWAHYNHGYTSAILNIPQEDSVAYRRSSPIYHAEGLRGALLICHGIVDVNVHVQDDMRLVQRLIELKKDNWEFAVYPIEDHGFVEPTSWRDEYGRILRLFEVNLGAE